jgi:hypothetical protein
VFLTISTTFQQRQQEGLEVGDGHRSAILYLGIFKNIGFGEGTNLLLNSKAMDEEKPIKRVPLCSLSSEDGVDELLDSPEMEPYVELAVAGLQGSNVQRQLQAIAELPLEKRYIWRVASALKWAFADFDGVNAKADKDTLADSDLARVLKLIKLRPMQFCMFLRALVGPVEMQRMMVDAIKAARMDLS